MIDKAFLLSKGYVETSPGVFEKPNQSGSGNTFYGQVSGPARVTLLDLQPKVKKGRPAASEFPPFDNYIFFEGKHTITFAGAEKGLNHSLLTQHWSETAKQKKAFIARVAAMKIPLIKGKVRLTYIRHGSRLMDWDNLCSSQKLVLDALVKNNVIEDDSPLVIVEFIPKQARCRHKDSKMEFIFEQLKS